MITAPVSRAAKDAALASAGAASPGDYTFLFKIAGDMNDEDNMLRMGRRAKAHAEELVRGGFWVQVGGAAVPEPVLVAFATRSCGRVRALPPPRRRCATASSRPRCPEP